MAGPDIIDAHHHLGGIHDSVGGLPGTGPGQSADDELAHRLAIMDDQDVSQAVIIAGHAYLRPDGIEDTRRVNDGVAAYCAATPGRFPAGVGVAEPLYGERGLDEIDRCRRDLGFAGMSFHARFQGVSLDSPWVRRFVERIGDNGMVPYLHAIADSPENALWKIDVLAASFPDLPMLVVDAFTNFEQAREVVPIAERRENLLFDTSLAYTFRLIEPLVERCGAQRVVFGTDIYSWPTSTKGSHVLGEILASALSEADKALVLAGNVRRVLGIEGGSI